MTSVATNERVLFPRTEALWLVAVSVTDPFSA